MTPDPKVHVADVRVLRVSGVVRFQAYCKACRWVGAENHADRFAAFAERDAHEFEAARG